MATSSTNSTDNMIPPELEVGLREDNITFWHEHRGFTRPQLHGHRVGEAYASLKSFVTTRRASNDSSIESRLRLYATLLWKEMRLYEMCRSAVELKPGGSYRTLRRLFKALFLVKGSMSAAAIEKAVVDGPEPFEVEEEAWPAGLVLGDLRWWLLIDSGREVTLDNIRQCERDDSDTPLAELDNIARRGPSPEPPTGSKPPESSSTEAKRNLRSIAPPHRFVRAPTPRPRLHARGTGGLQLDAERVVLGNGANDEGVDSDKHGQENEPLDEAADEGREGEEDARSQSEGAAPAPSASTPVPESDDVPEDIVQLFKKLRPGSKAYQWRAPAGISPKIPRGGLKTVEEIRAAHTDANGKITSFATLSEVVKTREWGGLKRGSECAQACRPCRTGEWECHFWNRKACTNCFITKGRCAEFVHPGLRIMGTVNKDVNPWEPRPERRFWLLKQLEDVMGGWDKRLNAVGETKGDDDDDAESDDKPATRPAKGGRPEKSGDAESQDKPKRKPKAAKAKKGVEPYDKPVTRQTKGGPSEKTNARDGASAPRPRNDSMDVEPTITLGRRGALQPVVFDSERSDAEPPRGKRAVSTDPEPMEVDDDDAGHSPPEDAPAVVPMHPSSPRSTAVNSRESSTDNGPPNPAEHRPTLGGPSRSTKPARNVHAQRPSPRKGLPPRRVAEMEPESAMHSPGPVDRPRVVSLPNRVLSESPSDSSSESSHMARGCGNPTCDARLTVLERLVRDDHSLRDARFDTLQAGVLTSNTSMQNVINVAVSAENHARRAGDACSRIALQQEDNLKYQRAVLDELASRLGLSKDGASSASSGIPSSTLPSSDAHSGIPSSTLPSSDAHSGIPSSTLPSSDAHATAADRATAEYDATAATLATHGVNLEAIIKKAVESTGAAFNDKYLRCMTDITVEAARGAAELKEQAKRDAAALSEQAARDADALQAVVKALDDKIERRFATLSLVPDVSKASAGVDGENPAAVETGVPTEVNAGSPKVAGASGGPDLTKATLHRVSVEPRSAYAVSAPLAPSPAPGLRSAASVSPVELSGGPGGSDGDAIESDLGGSPPPGPTKRRASDLEDTNKQSDEPRKRRRSASPTPRDESSRAP